MMRPLRVEDAAAAADQHAALMVNSVFAVFGAGFLACFYRHFARSPHAIAFVEEGPGGACAYIASTSDRHAFLRSLALRHGLRLAVYAVRGVLFHRECRRMLWQTLRYLRRTGQARTPAEMVFITVPSALRGRRVALELIEATLAEFRRRQISTVSVTIESDNAPILKILNGMGFQSVDRFIFAGKPNDLLIRALS